MTEEYQRRGPWYEEEDERLKAFVAVLGERRWDSIARASGLRRSGKSCRLRWLNYLRPCLKHGPINPEEEEIILQLHEKWGNKWAKIARRLPGRTDNEIKNYWRTHLRKKMQMQNTMHYFPFPIINNILSTETSSSSNQTNNTNQDASSQEGDIMITREISSNNNDDLGIKIGPHYEKELPDYTITCSPYENRLSEWMITLSRDQNDEFGSEFGFDCAITSNLEDRSAWDCPDTLWDMDLFPVNS